FGASAPMLKRVADGVRSTAVLPQLGQLRRPRVFCESKSSAEENQPSKRWPPEQSRSKTIIACILQWRMPASRSHLVFLHGLGGGHHAWDRQLPYFSSLGFPSHAWDQPGYGHSATVEPYDLEHIVLSLKLLVEK